MALDDELMRNMNMAPMAAFQIQPGAGFNTFSNPNMTLPMQASNAGQVSPMLAQPISYQQPAYAQQQPMQAPQQQGRPDLSQVSTDQYSPFGHVGDILNQYIETKQQQNNPDGFAQQILAQRFQPTPRDTGMAAIQNAQAYAPNGLFKPTTPEEQAQQRMGYEFAPYSSMLDIQGKEADIAMKQAHASFYGNKGAGGVVGALADRLKMSDPTLTDEQAIYLAQTGMRQGTTMQNGQIMPIAGAVPAKAAFAGAEAQARFAGETTAKAQFDLPSVVATSNQSLVDIDNLITDPALDAISGLRGMFPPVPGTPGANALARLKQIGGQTFLTAYNQLRGGGAISDAEGNRAITAKGRLDQAQSKEDIIGALKELQSVVKTGVEVAKLKAGGNPGEVPADFGTPPPSAGGAPVADGAGATHRYNPATGQIEVLQ